ncbi:hypothetical protein KP509_27G011900 [Ceratopteris richardii]|nr:hypothetical protein KP509_27G011900 [Ceratopteris richardii]
MGLKAKVLEQVATVGGDSKGASRACVVAMAKSVANGYADALAEVGRSQNNLESIAADVDKLGHFCEDEQFYKFFVSPVVKDEHKKEVVKSLGKEANFTNATVNLLNLLITKKRTMILKDLIKEFEEIYNKLTDTEIAFVTSAVEIDKSQLSLISQKLQSMSGSKNVKLKNIIDKSVIAGFIVRFGEDGSRLIDMSVKGQLDKIASQIELADKAAAF